MCMCLGFAFRQLVNKQEYSGITILALFFLLAPLELHRNKETLILLRVQLKEKFPRRML